MWTRISSDRVLFSCGSPAFLEEHLMQNANAIIIFASNYVIHCTRKHVHFLSFFHYWALNYNRILVSIWSYNCLRTKFYLYPRSLSILPMLLWHEDEIWNRKCVCILSKQRFLSLDTDDEKHNCNSVTHANRFDIHRKWKCLYFCGSGSVQRVQSDLYVWIHEIAVFFPLYKNRKIKIYYKIVISVQSVHTFFRSFAKFA